MLNLTSFEGDTDGPFEGDTEGPNVGLADGEDVITTGALVGLDVGYRKSTVNVRRIIMRDTSDDYVTL